MDKSEFFSEEVVAMMQHLGVTLEDFEALNRAFDEGLIDAEASLALMLSSKPSDLIADKEEATPWFRSFGWTQVCIDEVWGEMEQRGAVPIKAGSLLLQLLKAVKSRFQTCYNCRNFRDGAVRVNVSYRVQ